ncbi:hypothetical protein [Bradyrhizobium sp. 2S1]|uniref:hypothetical protein n=1 Tax=Bradyrhizobium sp. 2S1 TaxID=1404429 RepID=UPI0015958F32
MLQFTNEIVTVSVNLTNDLDLPKMTLIASMNDFPLMLSDLAASTDKLEQPSEVQLPTFAEGIQFTHRGRQIAGLVQKSILLAPDLALSWSGRLDQARGVAKRLFEDAPF